MDQQSSSSGLSSTDQVSIVALVVSLIALGVALGQLVQQYFATADGLRRCQSSVMGPWASLTRLRFRWRELRFETRFTTPQFRLVDTPDMDRPEESQPPKHQKKPLFNFKPAKRQNPHRKTDAEASLKHMDTASRKPVSPDFLITGDDMGLPRALREAVQDGSRSTDLVTWAGLLHSLHSYQKAVDDQDTEFSGTADHARVAIKLNEWSWDLVPPDLVRPYATCTTGTLIALAHRLGMQWTSLEPSKGEMNAEGNGHDLSSTTIRGLGLVFTYNHDERMNKISPKVIPSHFADKLRCGIIGSDGAETLGVSETFLTAPNGRQAPPDKFWRDLKVSRFVQAMLTDPHNIESLDKRDSEILHVVNDIICLSCPFLPLKNDWRNSVTWPIHVYAFSTPFIFWEGRQKLLERCRQYVESHPSNVLAAAALDNLTLIEERYHADFFSDWENAVSSTDHEAMRNYIDFLRGIFDSTTATFNAQQSSPTPFNRQLKYQHLLGAHITMATLVAREAREKAEAVASGTVLPPDEQHQSPTTPVNQRLPSFTGTSTALTRFIAQVSDHYVDNLGRVVGHLQGRTRSRGDRPGTADIQIPGLMLSTEEIEGLWWTLMVRGISWSMSLNLSYQKSAVVVPSHMYYSPTTVYII